MNTPTLSRRAEQGVERRAFKALFCEHFECSTAQFERHALRRCLYAHARLLAPLVRLLQPGFFARDLIFIRYLGRATELSEVAEAASEFHDKGALEKGFWGTGLKLRVSGAKALKLARELFPRCRPAGRDSFEQRGG